MGVGIPFYYLSHIDMSLNVNMGTDDYLLLFS